MSDFFTDIVNIVSNFVGTVFNAIGAVGGGVFTGAQGVVDALSS